MEYEISNFKQKQIFKQITLRYMTKSLQYDSKQYDLTDSYFVRVSLSACLNS